MTATENRTPLSAKKVQFGIGPPAIIAGIVAVAWLWQSANPVHYDMSWLIVVAERWLDGEQLYVDLLETNPPASVFLYTPIVVIARGFGVAPETLL